MSGEKGEQEWQTMWGAEVKVINPGNLMPDDMLKSSSPPHKRYVVVLFLKNCNRQCSSTPVFESRNRLITGNALGCIATGTPRPNTTLVPNPVLG